MMTESCKVLVLPGDGVGPEVIGEAERVLDWFVLHRGLRIDLRRELYSLEAYRQFGVLMPDVTKAAVAEADIILFGAMGGPEFEALPDHVRFDGDLLQLRRMRSLFANVRPVRAIAALEAVSPLKKRVLAGVDLVIVRELSSGVYFGEPKGVHPMADGGRRGVNTHVYTSAEICRVAEYAFQLARTRRGRVCSVDKANVMDAGRLWREEVQALRDAAYPDVTLSHMYADNCALQLVRAPAQFDVILTDNLFGDILSDGAAAVMGSLGMSPSASVGPVGPNGRRPALYEPVHGSAPDLAGQGLANPLGAILSLAMAFRLSLERPQDAALLEQAVEAALDAGFRTPDLAEPGRRTIGSREMTNAVLASLDTLSNTPFAADRAQA